MAIEPIQEEYNGQNEVTPTQSEVLKTLRDAIFKGLCVSMPAEVIKYDRKKQTVDAKPYLVKKYKDGEEKELDVIYNVPVAFQRAGNAFIAMPLKKGQNVLLIFSDRNLEKWLKNGKRQYPDSQLIHNISNAIAIPGLYPFSNSVSLPNDDDIIIHNEDLDIKIKPNGHIQISNRTDELIKVLNDMLQILREAVVMTGSNGPQKLRHWKFSAVKKRLASFQEK